MTESNQREKFVQYSVLWYCRKEEKTRDGKEKGKTEMQKQEIESKSETFRLRPGWDQKEGVATEVDDRSCRVSGLAGQVPKIGHE